MRPSDFIWFLCFNLELFFSFIEFRFAAKRPVRSRHSGHVATWSRCGRRSHLPPRPPLRNPGLIAATSKRVCVIELTSVFGRNPIGRAVRDRRRGKRGGRPYKSPATTAGSAASHTPTPEALGATLMKKQQQCGSAGVDARRCHWAPGLGASCHRLNLPSTWPASQ